MNDKPRYPRYQCCEHCCTCEGECHRERHEGCPIGGHYGTCQAAYGQPCERGDGEVSCDAPGCKTEMELDEQPDDETMLVRWAREQGWIGRCCEQHGLHADPHTTNCKEWRYRP